MSHLEAIKSGKIPAKACVFAAEVSVGDSADGSTAVPITLKARSGKVVDNFWWGRIVHDFAGMSVRDKIPLDYRHDDDHPVGFSDNFDTSTNDLIINGFLTPDPSDPHDPTNRIIAKARAGVPYQASIFFDEPIELELLDVGETAEVNGELVAGPATIVRTWTLRGVAVCLYGVDSNTDAELKFTRSGDIQARLISKEPTQMAKTPVTKPAVKKLAKKTPAPAKKLCNKLADDPAEKKPEDEAPADDADEMADEAPADAAPAEGDDAGECECNGNAPDADEGNDSDALADDAPAASDAEGDPDAKNKQAATPKSEGQKFLKAFGKMGGVWFAEGKTFAQAQRLHLTALEESNKKLSAENTKLRKQVDEGLGDSKSLSFSGEGSEPKHKRGLALSAGLSRFANSIKLPGAASDK